MTTQMRSRTSRQALAVIASVMVIGGVVALIVGLHSRHGPPTPPHVAAGVLYRPPPTHPATSSTAIPAPPHTTTSTSAPMTSLPTAISIPSIGVHSTLIRLGLNADGSLQVPARFDVAGWYTHSVPPGAVGPAIIVGHVDSKAAPGVFYRLGNLRPGDDVDVSRADGTTAHFVITAVRSYPKTQFPTIDVYGNTATPTIRLITCGGAFNTASGHYLNNTIAWGQLTS